MEPNKNMIIIAGGRDFNDYQLLKTKCDTILSNLTDIIIISGGARGADKLGEFYAIEKGYNYIVKEADWDKFGKTAGFIRNREMAEAATHLIAFWNGRSKGTKNMIEIANNLGLKTRVINYGIN